MSDEWGALGVSAGIVLLLALWFGASIVDRAPVDATDHEGTCTRALPQSC